MSYLPTDIWLYISTFIPEKDIRNLYSLNSFFLNLALDERYHEISFLQVHSKTIMLLEHIRDMNISSRVRRLRVNPTWFELETTESKPSNKSVSSFMLRTLSFSLKPRKKCNKYDHGEDHGPLSLKTRIRINELSTDLILQFVNVTSFVIVTHYWPHSESSPSFLTSCWQTFGPRLRRLTINAYLAAFIALLPAPSQLCSLEELTIRFSTDLTTDQPDVDTQLFSELIVPFLQKVTPKLRTLNLMSSALGDHSALFQNLGHMPYLTTLSLNVGFYPPLLRNTFGLSELFTKNVPNLKHLRLQPLSTFRRPPPSGKGHDFFSNWVTDNASTEHFLNNLETLIVQPPPDNGMTIDTSPLIIPRSKDTLINLVLGERCLSFADLTTLVGNFAHRTPAQGLKVLYIKLISLSPQTFDLLAEKLPGLDDLDVRFNFLLDEARNENPDPVVDEETTPE
ncbi:hypothetical protein H0H93_011911, partial [Arthromyces matolae]